MLHDSNQDRDLKPRDHKIIELVSKGLKNVEIAQEIGTTEHVVKNYLRMIYDKLGMWNRLELALWHVSRQQLSNETASLWRGPMEEWKHSPPDSKMVLVKIAGTGKTHPRRIA